MILMPKTDASTTTIPQRAFLPDLLRGVAVVLMVQVHLTELFANESWFNSLGGQLSLFFGGAPAAPLFMVFMGFFAGKQKKTCKKLFFRGVKFLAYGLLLNIGLNFHLFYKIFTHGYQVDPLPYLFGVDIFFLAGISMMIIALFKKVFQKSILLWSLLFLVLAFVNPFLSASAVLPDSMKYIQSFFYGNFLWSYFPLFPWGAYPVAGVIGSLIAERWSEKWWNERNQVLLFMMLFIVLLISFPFGFSRTIDLQSYYHHNGLLVFWNLAFVTCWVLFFGFLSSPESATSLTKWLVFAGRNVTAFYVFQWLWIGNLATLVYKSQFPLPLLIWFVCLILATHLCVKLQLSISAKLH